MRPISNASALPGWRVVDNTTPNRQDNHRERVQRRVRKTSANAAFNDPRACRLNASQFYVAERKQQPEFDKWSTGDEL